VTVRGDVTAEAFETAAGVAFGSKEDGAVIVIDADNRIAQLTEINRDFRANQAAGARYQYGLIALQHKRRV
jgi:hypothetical protein